MTHPEFNVRAEKFSSYTPTHPCLLPAGARNKSEKTSYWAAYRRPIARFSVLHPPPDAAGDGRGRRSNHCAAVVRKRGVGMKAVKHIKD